MNFFNKNYTSESKNSIIKSHYYYFFNVLGHIAFWGVKEIGICTKLVCYFYF